MTSGLRLALLADDGRPCAELLAALAPAERARARALPTEARRRHFAFGRLAARLALGRLAPDVLVEVLAGASGEPVVGGALQGRGLRVSISHDDDLAAACAWTASRERRLVGIDVERLRDCDVAESSFAFTRCERGIVRSAGGSHAGLAAWATKEAAWKALVPDPSAGPESVEVLRMDLTAGRAEVRVRPPLARRSLRRAITVRLRSVRLPNDRYLLALAETVEH